MNTQNVKSNWEAFEKAFGAYLFGVRKLGQTVKWTSDSPEMMKSLLRKGTGEADNSISACIKAVENIVKEVK